MRDLELITWRDIVDGLRRRQGLVLRVGGAGLLLMTLMAMAMAPTYEATATLLVSATRSRSISPDADAMPLVDRVEEEDLNSQAELLQSAALIRRVLEPQLDQMPERGAAQPHRRRAARAGRAPCTGSCTACRRRARSTSGSTTSAITSTSRCARRPT